MRLRLLLLMLIGGAVMMVNAQPPTPLYTLPNPRTPLVVSGSIDLASNGRTLVTANMLNDTVSIVDVGSRSVITEIPVGDDPRTITYSENNALAAVVNRGDATFSIIDVDEGTVRDTFPVGLLPYGVVMNDNETAFISLQAENAVVQMDITTGEVLTRIETPPAPSGFALWGEFLYVTHLWSGNVSLIYLPEGKVVRTVSTGPETSLTPSIAINRDNGRAYVPQSRSNAGNPALTYDSAVLPVVNVLDLRDMELQQKARIPLYSADRPVNMPFAAVTDAVRERIYVANAGTNDLSVIDLETGLAEANLEVGANPRDVLLNLDRSFLYVHNAIEGSLTVVDTRSLNVTDILPISDLQIPVDQLLGAELFYSAVEPRVGSRWLSCASCHFDGQSDGRVWQDFPGGARNTPMLYNLEQTAPYNWSGNWDELADVERKVRNLQAGRGLIPGDINPPQGDPHAGRSLDLDILVSYLLTLEGPESPVEHPDTLVERGRDVFKEQDCVACHSGEAMTDGMQYDVGTGGTFDTPTLKWLWQSAPYLHDGRAETLFDVFVLPGGHQLIDEISVADIEALVAYLETLP